MNLSFCTIATESHLPFARVLHRSLQQQSANVVLHVLVVDAETLPSNEAGLFFYDLSAVNDQPHFDTLLHKYRATPDFFRWALKPLFLLALLPTQKKLVYADVDLCFFAPFDFIFDELDQHSAMLTPHWASFSPLPHRTDFELNFRIGLYNAGFVATTAKAEKALLWWAAACAFQMANEPETGYFVDQRYLDLLPLLDEGVAVLRHPGCNVAGWNIHQNRRSVVDGQVLINETYPIVFIHFNQSTFDQLLQGNDPLLEKYLRQYKDLFGTLGYDFDEVKPGIKASRNLLIKWKRTLRVRTRLRQILFFLWQKLQP